MKLYLGRMLNGGYCLTAFRPRLAAVRGTHGKMDLYEREGEPIGVRHLCAAGIKTATGLELAVGEVVRVNLGFAHKIPLAHKSIGMPTKALVGFDFYSARVT